MICLVSSLASGFDCWSENLHRFTVDAVIIQICAIISTLFYIKIYRIDCWHEIQIHALNNRQCKSSDAGGNLNIAQLKRSVINNLRLLRSFHYMLSSNVCFIDSSWTLRKGLANRMGICYYSSIMNSSINPFLYCWRLRELRTAVIKTARQMSCKETEAN